VAIHEPPIRGVNNMPDNAITRVVLHLIDKIIVCPRARRRIRNDATRTTAAFLAVVRALRASRFEQYHCCPSPRNLSSSTTGKSRCRNARFGFNSPRLIKRWSELAEIPPRYSQASFSLSAPCLTETAVRVSAELHCCSVSLVFNELQLSLCFLSTLT